MQGDIPESLFVMFQMTFAIITPALIIGGYAERMKFSSVILFSGIWLLAIYVPITHWVWGGGWLAQMGLYDFAGGTVVHITAGVFSATTLGIFSGFGFADGISSMAGQLKVQFIGVLATAGYTAVVSFIILKFVSFLTNGLRVTEEQEIQGLDIHLHEERGYDL